jgi:hypothetical protein
LYGPPQVVTAPPYYGPYYGGYDFAHPSAYGPNGSYSGWPNGTVYGAPIEQAVPQEQESAANRETLPESAP